MRIDEIKGEALQLNPHDRANLAETIWESLEDPFKFLTDITEEEAIKLAQHRENEIEQGKALPLSHKMLMDRLRK